MKNMKHIKIGFVGQGVVGKAIADDFEKRGYETVRYSLEKEHVHNKEKIRECELVFIAVPTPTLLGKQDLSNVQGALTLLGGKNKIAIIKSTVLPQTTDTLQKEHPDILIVHSPEFLSANTAAKEAAEPFINIIGIPQEKYIEEKDGKNISNLVAILPSSPVLICTANEAEVIKFSHNIHGYFQVVFWNIMYDYAKVFGAEWATVQKALQLDPMIASQYSNPIHKSGRGAGGHCFIKDYSSFVEDFIKMRQNDTITRDLLKEVERKNLELLIDSKKDLDILRSVYGNAVIEGAEKNQKHVPKDRSS